LNCSAVCDLLAEYIEGNLTNNVSQTLSEHLQGCKACATEESLLRSLSETLHSLPQKSAPVHFTEGVMKSLLEAETVSEEEALARTSILSSVISATGLWPTWFGMKMAARSAKVVTYVPRPTAKLRIGEARSRSLTKLPLALGLRW